MKLATSEKLHERLIEVSGMKLEKVEILCWRLNGRLKRVGNKIFIAYTPSKLGMW